MFFANCYAPNHFGIRIKLRNRSGRLEYIYIQFSLFIVSLIYFIYLFLQFHLKVQFTYFIIDLLLWWLWTVRNNELRFSALWLLTAIRYLCCKWTEGILLLNNFVVVTIIEYWTRIILWQTFFIVMDFQLEIKSLLWS